MDTPHAGMVIRLKLPQPANNAGEDRIKTGISRCGLTQMEDGYIGAIYHLVLSTMLLLIVVDSTE